jgi:hypothetical protein
MSTVSSGIVHHYLRLRAKNYSDKVRKNFFWVLAVAAILLAQVSELEKAIHQQSSDWQLAIRIAVPIFYAGLWTQMVWQQGMQVQEICMRGWLTPLPLDRKGLHALQAIILTERLLPSSILLIVSHLWLEYVVFQASGHVIYLMAFMILLLLVYRRLHVMLDAAAQLFQGYKALVVTKRKRTFHGVSEVLGLRIFLLNAKQKLKHLGPIASLLLWHCLQTHSLLLAASLILAPIAVGVAAYLNFPTGMILIAGFSGFFGVAEALVQTLVSWKPIIILLPLSPSALLVRLATPLLIFNGLLGSILLLLGSMNYPLHEIVVLIIAGMTFGIWSISLQIPGKYSPKGQDLIRTGAGALLAFFLNKREFFLLSISLGILMCIILSFLFVRIRRSR